MTMLLKVMYRQLSEAVEKNDRVNVAILEGQITEQLRKEEGVTYVGPTAH